MFLYLVMNIKLEVKRGDDEFDFIILKSHKETFALANKLTINRSVYAEGISNLRMTICTKLKTLDKGADDSKQVKLGSF